MGSLVDSSENTGKIVGQDVINLCLDLLSEPVDMSTINHTILVLICKSNNPTTMRHFWPINLCTIIYKIVAKKIINRMKAIIINNTQAAFVKGRNITDNILIAHELVHSLNTGDLNLSQGDALKLDMEKAYDMAEQQNGQILGLCTSRYGLRVNHLLFVDDCMVFIRNNTMDAYYLKQVLNTYALSSGQDVNLEKSIIFFNPRQNSVLCAILTMKRLCMLCMIAQVQMKLFICVSWIIDSGATDHIVHSVSFFSSYSVVHDKFVKLPNNELVQVCHIGTVKINDFLVLHNEVSPWKMIGIARLTQGLYQLDVKVSSSIFNSVVCNSSSLQLWHARLGHPSSQRMKFFSELNKDVPSGILPDCETCHLAKQKRPSFPVSTSVSNSIFDLIHMDVWGPFPIKSLYGHSYFLTIVDDKSRFLWVFPLKEKSEVRKTIIHFFAFAEVQFSKRIKCVRSDNAKEFDMSDFFKEKGVLHQNACTYTPQQNSVVERKHQHILAVARALRLQANLPLSFWIDCVMHAVFLINLTPTPVLDNKTPFELFYCTKPDISSLRTFGCLCYASVLPKAKTKMHPRAIKCLFLGYPKNVKGFRLYDLEKQAVFVSRDVVFSEAIFPFKQTKETVNEVVLPVYDNNNLLDDVASMDKTAVLSSSSSLEEPFSGMNSQSAEALQSADQPDEALQVVETVQPVEQLSFPSRPSRNRRLPQKFNDFSVSLPKVRSTPHDI
ncbi:hypothetical protein GQ457_13G009720 [Hibiscus cannabinus]